MPAQAPVVPLVNRPLEQLEAVIERGLQSYREIGDALREIQERRLYRETYSTFDEYIQGRWKISRGHAYRLIAAARVADIVSIGDIPAPLHEGQARVLAAVEDAENMQSFWAEARERYREQPTAEQIRAVIYPALLQDEPLDAAVQHVTRLLNDLADLEPRRKSLGERLGRVVRGSAKLSDRRVGELRRAIKHAIEQLNEYLAELPDAKASAPVEAQARMAPRAEI